MNWHRLNRRSVLSGAAALGAASVADHATAAPSAGRGERPNILWLVSEDNNPFIGAYGDQQARTPTIDRLARQGVLYRHAYSSAPVCAPSRFAILTGLSPEACGPAHHMRAEATLPTGMRTYPEVLREAGYYCTNSAKTDYNCTIDPQAIWSASGRNAHWRNRPASAPFMAVFNFETTHETVLFRGMKGRLQPDQVQIPANLPDLPGIRADIATYYNAMERMDGQLAARLAELDAAGLADDTIVFYYSDNGGTLPRSKRYCSEAGLHCALVIYAPPKWQHLLPVPAGSEVTSPVSLMDLAATVVRLAGVTPPAQMQGTPLLRPHFRPQAYVVGGRGRMDERIDLQRTITDGRWRYVRNYLPHRPAGRFQAFAWLARGYQDYHAAWLNGRLAPEHARFFAPRPYEELYDLQADPHELVNRAADPLCAAHVRRLGKQLNAHMLRINDNGFLPEAMAGEGYFSARDQGVYPLRAVLALAAKAAVGREHDLPAITAALSHPAPVMRYWAATGCVVQGARVGSARVALQQLMQHDPAPQVRIAAAEAVATSAAPGADVAIGVLADLAGASQPWQVQLQALDALTALGQAALPARAAVLAASQSEQDYVRNAGRYLLAVLDGTFDPHKPIFELDRLLAKAGASL